MYALQDITGTTLLLFIGRESIGRFDVDAIDDQVTNRDENSVPGLVAAEFAAASASCGGELTESQTTKLNGAILWKTAAELAKEAIALDGDCENCPNKLADFAEYACNQAYGLAFAASPCIASKVVFACGTEDDLPDIFSSQIVDCGSC